MKSSPRAYYKCITPLHRDKLNILALIRFLSHDFSWKYIKKENPFFLLWFVQIVITFPATTRECFMASLLRRKEIMIYVDIKERRRTRASSNRYEQDFANTSMKMDYPSNKNDEKWVLQFDFQSFINNRARFLSLVGLWIRNMFHWI